MSIFTDDKSAEVQFTLIQDILDSLYVGIIAINAKHEIVRVNKVIADRTGYEQGWLIGREIHDLVPPDFREMHRTILDKFFSLPYHVAIEQRTSNAAKMKMVPKGTDGEPDKWLPVRIGIHPLLVDPSREVFQTGEVIKRVALGLAEISFEDTFNVLGG